MMKKLINLLIITTVTIMLIVTVILLIYVYRADRHRKEGNVIMNESLSPKTSGLLQKDTGNPMEEAVVRMVFFLQDEENEKLLSGAYLCFYHKKDKTVDFFYLDGNTVLEISGELYRDLTSGITGLPQISKLSHLYTFSKSELSLKAGMLMINDVVGTDLRHFALLPHNLVKEAFSSTKGESNSLKKDYFFKSDIKDFLNKEYRDKYTDFSKEFVAVLLKDMSQLREENIRFKDLPHIKTNRGFFIEKEEALRLMYSNENK